MRNAGTVLVGFAALMLAAGQAQAWSGAGPWSEGPSSRARLLAASDKAADGSTRLTAAVQIEIKSGWYTYWRSPGDAGGVPPLLDFKKSANLASSAVMFPAPSRLHHAEGDTIGYTRRLTIPVALTATDAAKPVALSLLINYGVCKNICVPEERELTVSLDPSGADDAEAGSLLRRALDEVPADASKVAKAPQVTGLKLETVEGKPSLLVEAQFPEGTAGADLFIEALDNGYVPLPAILADSGDGHVRFRLDLTKSDDLKAPSGKQLRLTLVSDAGASESLRTVP